jgi:hypothetical protein
MNNSKWYKFGVTALNVAQMLITLSIYLFPVILAFVYSSYRPIWFLLISWMPAFIFFAVFEYIRDRHQKPTIKIKSKFRSYIIDTLGIALVFLIAVAPLYKAIINDANGIEMLMLSWVLALLTVIAVRFINKLFIKNKIK